jgi:DNA mismatch endonuclease (patch repair protein)
MTKAGAASWASSPAVRASMVANRSTGTSPERELLRALARRGIRHGRPNVKVRVPSGTIVADVVFVRAHVAVFVDGCFWHACPWHATWPKVNGEWWRLKLQANRDRDRRQRRLLRTDGWGVIRVWTHERPEKAAGRIAARLARDL